jgi:hypothetical protein
VRGFDGNDEAQDEGGKGKEDDRQTTDGEDEKDPSEDLDRGGCLFWAGEETVGDLAGNEGITGWLYDVAAAGLATPAGLRVSAVKEGGGSG